MPVLTGQDDELLSEQVGPNQGIVHTHYNGSSRAAVSLHENPEDDEEYEGEPLQCPFCEFNADYVEGVTGEKYSYHYEPFRDVYVCDHNGCGWYNEDEAEVKRHYTRAHKSPNEAEDITPEDLGSTGGAEYDITFNEETGEYDCGQCDYSNEDEANVKRHQTQVHSEEE